jgi:hypothetical protein
MVLSPNVYKNRNDGICFTSREFCRWFESAFLEYPGGEVLYLLLAVSGEFTQFADHCLWTVFGVISPLVQGVIAVPYPARNAVLEDIGCPFA